MSILKFKQFSLNEKLGIADATIFYVDAIFDKTLEEFKKFNSSDEKHLHNVVDIPYRNFSKKITDRDLYAKFPVVDISLDLEFKKLNTEIFNKIYKTAAKRRKKHTIGGYSMKFGNKNWSGYSRIKEPIKSITDHGISIVIGIEVYISEDFNIGTYHNKLIDDINECVWHELNHSYEYYQRYLSGSGSILKRAPGVAVTYADNNKWNLTKSIYDYWSDNFILYLYTSEPYELNAQIQEAGFYVTKYGFDSLKKTMVWKYADVMEKFDADKFMEGLISKIKKEGKDVKTTTENLKKMWLGEYRKTLKEFDEEPTINDKLVAHLDCEGFVKLIGRRLNRAGQYLKKKLDKLYALDQKQIEE